VAGPIFHNNLSHWTNVASGQSDRAGGPGVPSTPDNCWWNKSKDQPSINSNGLIVTEADFIALTPTISRDADGNLVLGNFLKLTPGSDLIDAGTPSGTDIGAIESK
jgi:hypothetical protein